MRKLHVFASALIVTLLVASCGLTGNGFGGSSIQKRKYTKGFYFNKNNRHRGQESDKSETELLTADENVTKTTDETVAPLRLRKVDPSVISEQNTIENRKQPQPQQRQEEKKKKSATQARKEVKTSTTTRQRKPREHEFYIPMKSTTKQISSSVDTGDPVILILLIILCFLIPPLAVYFYEGLTKRFWIDLILALVGIGIGILIFGGFLAWVCAIAAVIYALLIVLGAI